MSLLRTPKNAWPTIALGLVAFATFVAVFALAAARVLPLPIAGVIAFIAAFVAFTPMHDSSHRSVSRNKTLNEFIGRISSIPLAAPFAAFRYVHLEHHKHTNEPEHDPDHYAGRGPKWQLPLRWLSQDLHYYVVVLRNWKMRPLRERLDVSLNLAGIVAIALFLAQLGYGQTVLFAWILPARLAIGALSFAFDYLPHVPHKTPASEDRYRATHIIEGVGLTPMFLYQNYHLIHHLYPGVPFYRYKRVFRDRHETLVARGAQIKEWSWLHGSRVRPTPQQA